MEEGINMKKTICLSILALLALAVYGGYSPAIADSIIADYGDAPGYGDAWNMHPEWQRLGTLWDSEAGTLLNDPSDDGISYSTISHGATFDVTFTFTMYKQYWGSHDFDGLKVWIDWNNDKNFADETPYVFYWDFKAENPGLNPYDLAGVSKDFTLKFEGVEDGSYWLRARVVCSADVFNDMDLYQPYGTTPSGFGQGETEDIKFANDHEPSTVPEPSTIMLLGLGLVGVAGVKRIRK
jgi:hypothetical protein